MRVIAELGINTNGSLNTALQMVEAAAEAGADGIKVQAYECADFLPENHPDWNLFWRNRLSWDDMAKVREHTMDLGMDFGATPTSMEGIRRLTWMGVDWLKNGSDFLLRHDLIEAMLGTGIETWVSTGMATREEVLAVPEGALRMACTSAYPCPDEEANLSRLTGWLIYHGYSDHTTGTTAGVMAVALMAQMFEFHFTLDHSMDGPDHAWSRDPQETAALVREIRRAEAMWGRNYGYVTPSEEANRERWRVTKDTLRG